MAGEGPGKTRLDQDQTRPPGPLDLEDAFKVIQREKRSALLTYKVMFLRRINTLLWKKVGIKEINKNYENSSCVFLCN